MSYVKSNTHQVNITPEQENFVQAVLLPLAQEIGIGIRLINCNGNSYSFNLSKEKELSIFVNSSFGIGSQRKYGLTINGLPIGDFDFLVGLEKTVVTTDSGFTIATYKKDIREMKILFNLFADPNYDHIFKEFLPAIRQIMLEIKHDGDWEYMDKEAIISPFVESEKRFYTEKLEQAKHRRRDAQRYIESYRAEIIKYNKQLAESMKDVERYSTDMDDTSFKENIIKQFDLINKHDKVTGFKIVDTTLYIDTVPIDAFHDVTGDRYHIGQFTIKIDLRDGDVRYMNNTNRRRSHWGAECNHPHVDDRAYGVACFGNVNESIADLVSQGEYYALTLVAIDFLENVNTSDTAGKYIINWDKVDEDGDVIDEGVDTRNPDDYDEDEDYCTCEHCDERYPEDEMHTVVTQVNYEGRTTGIMLVCNDCIDEFTWDESSERWFTDDAFAEYLDAVDPYVLVITEVDDDGEVADEDNTYCRESEIEDNDIYLDETLDEYVTTDVFNRLEEIREGAEA